MQRRSPRRAFLDAVIRDVCTGAQSLGEIDFAVLCRAAGLPEPTRQAVRVTATGAAYLDVWWEDLHVIVEIEGAHHTQGLTAVGDALRQNDLVLRDHDIFLRLPVLGLRVDRAAFMAQVGAALELGRQRYGGPQQPTTKVTRMSSGLTTSA